MTPRASTRRKTQAARLRYPADGLQMPQFQLHFSSVRSVPPSHHNSRLMPGGMSLTGHAHAHTRRRRTSLPTLWSPDETKNGDGRPDTGHARRADRHLGRPAGRSPGEHRRRRTHDPALAGGRRSGPGRRQRSRLPGELLAGTVRTAPRHPVGERPLLRRLRAQLPRSASRRRRRGSAGRRRR